MDVLSSVKEKLSLPTHTSVCYIYSRSLPAHLEGKLFVCSWNLWPDINRGHASIYIRWQSWEIHTPACLFLIVHFEHPVDVDVDFSHLSRFISLIFLRLQSLQVEPPAAPRYQYFVDSEMKLPRQTSLCSYISLSLSLGHLIPLIPYHSGGIRQLQCNAIYP